MCIRDRYYIDRLSTHIASKGTKYRSHAATIYKWAQEDEAKKPPKKGIPDYSCKEGEDVYKRQVHETQTGYREAG